MAWPNPVIFRATMLCGISILCGCERTNRPIVEVADNESREARADAVARAEGDEVTETSLLSAHGEKQFKSYCAACHQRGGQGVEGRVPPLNHSPWVSGSEDRLIRIVLNGLRGPIEIGGEVYNLEMPAFRMLFQDDDIASILSFVRQRYGAPSPPIKSETVSRVRKETEDRTSYWTVEELLRVP